MKPRLPKIILLIPIIVGIVAVSSNNRAEEKLSPKTDAPATTARTPFHGQASAVGTEAMTLTVRDLTLHVTAETQITRAGKPATLSDIAVGETVGGSYKKDEAGKLNAVNIRVAEKAPDPIKKKKASNGAPTELAAKK